MLHWKMKEVLIRNSQLCKKSYCSSGIQRGNPLGGTKPRAVSEHSPGSTKRHFKHTHTLLPHSPPPLQEYFLPPLFPHRWGMATLSRQLVKEGKRNLQTKSLAQQTAKDLWLLQKQEFTAALASHLLFFAFFFLMSGLILSSLIIRTPLKVRKHKEAEKKKELIPR